MKGPKGRRAADQRFGIRHAAALHLEIRFFRCLPVWLPIDGEIAWKRNSSKHGRVLFSYYGTCRTGRGGKRRVGFTCQFNADPIGNRLFIRLDCGDPEIRATFAKCLENEWGAGYGVHNFTNGYFRAEYILSNV